MERQFDYTLSRVLCIPHGSWSNTISIVLCVFECLCVSVWLINTFADAAAVTTTLNVEFGYRVYLTNCTFALLEKYAITSYDVMICPLFCYLFGLCWLFSLFPAIGHDLSHSLPAFSMYLSHSLLMSLSITGAMFWYRKLTNTHSIFIVNVFFASDRRSSLYSLTDFRDKSSLFRSMYCTQYYVVYGFNLTVFDSLSVCMSLCTYV